MSYQLVLQFPEASVDLDRLAGLEDSLVAALPGDEVDGHDAGSGEANIFVVTDDPQAAFARAKQVVDAAQVAGQRAAYRDLDDEGGSFHVLRPPGLGQFTVA